MPAIGKAQTTKQAKASYKARGRPTLTEKESRQLERAIELENRAERAKEAEKRRQDAAKKRVEQEKRDKMESQRKGADLGSQRRVDRFGFVASQFHLGAFFKKPGEASKTAAPKQKDIQEIAEDDFEDEDLDDEQLLNALDQKPAPAPKREQLRMTDFRKSDMTLMPPPPPPPLKTAKSEPPPAIIDLDDFWSELGSGTQIARELDSEVPERQNAFGSQTGFFSSGGFDDLTAEDLDELDPPISAVTVRIPIEVNAQQIMPPPALPADRPNRSVAQPRTSAIPTRVRPKPSMAPSRLPHPARANGLAPQARSKDTSAETKHLAAPMVGAPSASRPSQKQSKQQNAIKGPFIPASTLYCSPDLGFTMTQLETFVDDDIQLTQAVPG